MISSSPALIFVVGSLMSSVAIGSELPDSAVAASRTPPDIAACLDALAQAASTFALTAPGLMATETLEQRGRRGTIDLLKKATPADLRKSTIHLAEEFRDHQVISSWALHPAGEGHALHEIRQIESIDSKVIPATEARHALTIGLASADDKAKRELLENFEQEELEGAVVDFSQILLLFSRGRHSDYSFARVRSDSLGDEAVSVISYRQVSGEEGLTAFHDRKEIHEAIHGEIWLRNGDLLPVRITMNTEEKLSPKYTVRTQAQVDYTPSPYWLIPAAVTHQQFLNSDVVMENHLHYADFHRADRIVP